MAEQEARVTINVDADVTEAIDAIHRIRELLYPEHYRPQFGKVVIDWEALLEEGEDG